MEAQTRPQWSTATRRPTAIAAMQPQAKIKLNDHADSLLRDTAMYRPTPDAVLPKPTIPSMNASKHAALFASKLLPDRQRFHQHSTGSTGQVRLHARLARKYNSCSDWCTVLPVAEKNDVLWKGLGDYGLGQQSCSRWQPSTQASIASPYTSAFPALIAGRGAPAVLRTRGHAWNHHLVQDFCKGAREQIDNSTQKSRACAYDQVRAARKRMWLVSTGSAHHAQCLWA